MGNIIIFWAISPFQPFQGNTIFQPVPQIHCLEHSCWIQRSSNKLAWLFIASFSQHYTNRIDVFLYIYFALVFVYILQSVHFSWLSVWSKSCQYWKEIVSLLAFCIHASAILHVIFHLVVCWFENDVSIGRKWCGLFNGSTDMGMLESSYPHVASVFRCASTWRPCPYDLND